MLVGLPLFPGIAPGRVNPERMRVLDVEGVRTTSGGDLAVQSGNVDLFEVGVTTHLDVRVLHQATLGVNVTEHVRLHAELNLSYDSWPPDEVEMLHLALRNGMEVSF